MPILLNVTAIKMNQSKSQPINYWQAGAILELCVIAFLFIKIINRRTVSVAENINNPKVDFLAESKNGDVNMNDLMMNISSSKILYKKLSSKCHPDRFLDFDKNIIANNLFQDITKNQRNYQKLIELKDQAQKELGVLIN